MYIPYNTSKKPLNFEKINQTLLIPITHPTHNKTRQERHAGLRGAIALVLCWELGDWVDELEGAGTKETLVTSILEKELKSNGWMDKKTVVGNEGMRKFLENPSKNKYHDDL